MNFLIGLAAFGGALFYSCINNVTWITGDNNWKAFLDNKFPLVTRDGTYTSRLDYIFRGRILEVLKLTNWRDYSTSLIVGILAGVIF